MTIDGNGALAACGKILRRPRRRGCTFARPRTALLPTLPRRLTQRPRSIHVARSLPVLRFPRLALLLAVLCAPFAAYAQPAPLSGTVRDAATGETLVGANLYAPDFETGTVTNAYGFFSLALPASAIGADTVSVVVSYVGYQPLALRLVPGTGPHDLGLAPAPTELGTVDVVADRTDPLEDTQMSAVSVPIARIKSLPALLGEVDVLKALQLLPGVQIGDRGDERALRPRRRAGPEPAAARRRAGLQREPPLRLLLHLQRRRAQERRSRERWLPGALRRPALVGPRPADEGGEHERARRARAPSGSSPRASRSKGRL